MKSFEKLKDNLYVKLGNGDEFKLNFKKNLANNSLIFKDDEEVSNSDSSEEILPVSIPKYVKNLYTCDNVICRYNDDEFNLLYDGNIKTLYIDNEEIHIEYVLDIKLFNYTSNEVSFSANNGDIVCNKEDCKEDEKIYNIIFQKYIAPIE